MWIGGQFLIAGEYIQENTCIPNGEDRVVCLWIVFYCVFYLYLCLDVFAVLVGIMFFLYIFYMLTLEGGIQLVYWLTNDVLIQHNIEIVLMVNII